MSKALIAKLFEKRDLWSIGVFKFPGLNEIFESGPASLSHFHGEKRLRLSRQYQSVAADPFLFSYGERLYLFFEMMTDHRVGSIHCKSMSRDGNWFDHGEVLSEKYHLSYPQVFLHNGRIFMLPEAAQSGSVILYESDNFPFGWHLSSILVDAPLRDPTLVMTADAGVYLLGTTERYQLKLFHSNSIEGTFSEARAIITEDKKFARCAGGIFRYKNDFIRPAQDCSEVYGKSVSFRSIDNLSFSNYHERKTDLKLQIPIDDWMLRGSHHISVAEFDGSVYLSIDGKGADSAINSVLLAAHRIAERFSLFR